MKKTSGILLTLLLSSTLAVADEVTIDGKRLDWKYQQFGEDYVQSYPLSSISYTRKYQSQQNGTQYTIFIDTGVETKRLQSLKVDKDIYTKILDYLED